MVNCCFWFILWQVYCTLYYVQFTFVISSPDELLIKVKWSIIVKTSVQINAIQVTATYHIGNRSSMPITISNNSYLVCLTGTRLVVAAFCQPVETYKRAATERRRRTATFVYSSLRAPSSLFPRHLIRPNYRVIAIYPMAACGMLSQLGTWTRCEARPCARSLQWNTVCRAAGQSLVHRRRDRVLFIPRMLQSPTSLLTDSCTWRRRDEEVRKTSVFCN